MEERQKTEFLIIGGGIMGMAMARALSKRFPGRAIDLIEKEQDLGLHASGRNSGVLHAGFYYSADSLKARLTAAGNRMMREFCAEKNLPINDCGKLVIARNDEEVARLHDLAARGKVNGCTVELISAERARELDPNAYTWKEALYSPLTATVDPRQVCQAMKADLIERGVRVHAGERYVAREGDNRVRTNRRTWEPDLLINAAGLFADRIAHDFGFGKKYTIVPFRGRYIEYQGDSTQLRTNVYPVPDLRNPFLGVHFTKKIDGTLKIGPTATPSLWREHYGGLGGFSARDFAQIAWIQLQMFLRNTAGFRQLAWEEIKKYNRRYLVRSALKLVTGGLSENDFSNYGKPGIRAQLVDKATLKLVQDFIIESDAKSIHVLNAVSPGFTCSLSFAEHVLKECLKA